MCSRFKTITMEANLPFAGVLVGTLTLSFESVSLANDGYVNECTCAHSRERFRRRTSLLSVYIYISLDLSLSANRDYEFGHTLHPASLPIG